MTRYILVCGLLVLGIALAGWALRRFALGALKSKAAKRSMQVLDVLPLGGKHKLSVVRCYDRSFLLGLGEKEVRLIAELDREEQAEELTVKGKPFLESLTRRMKAEPGELRPTQVDADLARRIRRSEGVLG